MRVIVTGATGFIGTRVCQRLIDASLDVVAAVRSEDCTVPVGVTKVHVGDLNEDIDWRPHLEGVDAVVHLAALTHSTQDARPETLARYRRLNVNATRRLAVQAGKAGVSRFVYLSSIKVNGEYTASGVDATPRPFSGNDRPNPEGPYGETKLEAEQILNDAFDERHVALFNLRPPLVYGPGQKANLHTLMSWVSRGAPLPFAQIDNRRSMVFVDNLAEAVSICVANAETKPGTYTLADSEISTPDLIRAIARALEVEPRLFFCPPLLLKLGLIMLGKRDIHDKLTTSLVIDSAQFKAATGWSPSVPFEQAMRETASAFRQQGDAEC